MNNDQQKGMEIEGKTVEDAINKAMKSLKVSKEEMHIKIVCEE